MVPNFINSSAPSPFPVDPREDHDDPHDHHGLFLSNSSSSSSVSYSVFFNSPQDQRPEHCRFHQTHQEQPQQDQGAKQAPYTGSQGLADHQKPNKGLKISLWKKDENDDGDDDDHQENIPVKWMPSKIRLMQKMKKPDDYHHMPPAKSEDHSSLETDHFSSNSSSNNSSNTTTTPFRVCADCNTTKTPLWRSGPKGPKSLCNACGIRQRKARRALQAAAAAAASNGGGGGAGPQNETKTALKIKVQNKEKVVKNNGQFKKRSKVITTSTTTTAGPSHHHQHHAPPQKNNVFEDFLFNLSKNLACHRVFPQDEKEAAILLMALSSGLVHGQLAI